MDRDELTIKCKHVSRHRVGQKGRISFWECYECRNILEQYEECDGA